MPLHPNIQTSLHFHAQKEGSSKSTALGSATEEYCQTASDWHNCLTLAHAHAHDHSPYTKELIIRTLHVQYSIPWCPSLTDAICYRIVIMLSSSYLDTPFARLGTYIPKYLSRRRRGEGTRRFLCSFSVRKGWSLFVPPANRRPISHISH